MLLSLRGHFHDMPEPNWWLAVCAGAATVAVAAAGLGQLWLGGLVFGLVAFPVAILGVAFGWRRPRTRPLVAALGLGYMGFTVLCGMFFFTAPAVVSAAATICIALAFTSAR